jgi:predicted metal-binding membrane protein
MHDAVKKQAVGPVERLVRHDQRIVSLSVAVIVVLAATYTFFGAGMQMSALQMTQMARPIGEPMSMGADPVWTVSYAFVIFLMWWIMMIAMMTPSAAPMLLLYTALKRAGSDRDRAVALSFLFLLGYLGIWALFSAAATGLQALAEVWGLANGRMMVIDGRWLAALVFIAAGLYQLSNLKEACLTHCKSPAHFLAEHRHPGALGAVRTGARHGKYCLGCCWALMALLFVGGVMNLYWIVGIAIYVLLEKIVPDTRILVRLTGVSLMLFGAYLLATS